MVTRQEMTQLQEELKKMEDLIHIHIMELLGNCTDPSNICIFYDHSLTDSLQSILHDPDINFNVQEILQFALDICDGMDYLHQHEIYHLNLKSKNIMVTTGFKIG